MAVYTKTGDKGQTKVFDNKTGKLVGIRKSSRRIRTIGAIDELNSFLGVIIAFNEVGALKKRLREVQRNLFVINSILAGSNLRFSKTKTKKLERQIDTWEGSLPVLKNFIFYGGGQSASMIFYARALCRKAERELVKLEIGNWKLEILAYVNRLSDYLFMLGRSVNFDEGHKEDYWITSEKSKTKSK